MTSSDEIIGTFLPQVPAKFEPFAFYSVDGDCIEFFASNDDYYGKRLDSMVTVYISERTGEVIGSLIKGVRKLLTQFPGLRIDINKGNEVCLRHVIQLYGWQQGDPELRQTYDVLKRRADGLVVKVADAA